MFMLVALANCWFCWASTSSFASSSFCLRCLFSNYRSSFCFMVDVSFCNFVTAACSLRSTTAGFYGVGSATGYSTGFSAATACSLAATCLISSTFLRIRPKAYYLLVLLFTSRLLKIFTKIILVFLLVAAPWMRNRAASILAFCRFANELTLLDRANW